MSREAPRNNVRSLLARAVTPCCNCAPPAAVANGGRRASETHAGRWQLERLVDGVAASPPVGRVGTGGKKGRSQGLGLRKGRTGDCGQASLPSGAAPIPFRFRAVSDPGRRASRVWT